MNKEESKPQIKLKLSQDSGKDPKLELKEQRLNIMQIIFAGLIAALYVLFCLPFASFSFGIIQFRVAEALNVLAALTPAAIPGLFLGCLLSNVLNPDNLGLIDILGGSLTTLLAACLTFLIAKSYRKILCEERERKPVAYKDKIWQKRFLRLLMLLPPVILNAVVVGSYLPFLLIEGEVQAIEIIASIGSIFLSQSVIIYVIGLALLIAMENLKFPIFKD